MSGWWSRISAIEATSLTKAMASLKSLNLYSFCKLCIDEDVNQRGRRLSTQIFPSKFGLFFVFVCLSYLPTAHGQYGSSGGGSYSSNSPGYISETQQRRSVERFDILSFIRSQQAAVSAQNARYGKSAYGHGPYPDFVLTYFQDTGAVVRDGTTLGNDTRSGGHFEFLLDDLFTQGNSKRLLNIDLGFEAFLDQTTFFSAAANISQTSHSYAVTGGGVLIRPLGRSSQDTGFILKGGYLNFSETGLWSNSQNQIGLYAPYLGGEAKLYLLPVLGLSGEYISAIETSSDAIQGKWKMQRFSYGVFLEIYFLSVGAYYVSTEMDLTPASGSAATKEVYSGSGFFGKLYF